MGNKEKLNLMNYYIKVVVQGKLWGSAQKVPECPALKSNLYETRSFSSHPKVSHLCFNRSLIGWHAGTSRAKPFSLRSKRSRRDRMKEVVVQAMRKMGRAKRWKVGSGEGEKGPTPLLPPFCSCPIFRAARMWKTPLRGPNFIRFVWERG